MLQKSKFKHQTIVIVRSNEIDWHGIVHNALYLHYFEIGRMGYFETIGFPIVIDPASEKWKVVVARNEVDYRSPARFKETLDVYTRIAWIRNTSFALEGFIEETGSKRLVAENTSLHVWRDKAIGKPTPVPEFFRERVQKFEGDDVIISPTSIPI